MNHIASFSLLNYGGRMLIRPTSRVADSLFAIFALTVNDVEETVMYHVGVTNVAYLAYDH